MPGDGQSITFAFGIIHTASPASSLSRPKFNYYHIGGSYSVGVLAGAKRWALFESHVHHLLQFPAEQQLEEATSKSVSIPAQR